MAVESPSGVGAMTAGRWAAAVALGIAGLVVVAPFFVATAFIGDDHLFLALARHVPNPFSAFVADLHGGEYYRPVPLILWWCLGRLGGGRTFPFAILALALHAGVAWLLMVLLRALDRPRPVAWAASALMFLAPQNLEAALWFSANTDLLATIFVLASLVSLLRSRRVLSGAMALAAFLSKESAYVLPILAVLVLWFDPSQAAVERSRSGRRRLGQIAPQILLLAAVLVIRRIVLRGWGGSGDPRPDVLGIGLQIAGGWAHLFTGDQIAPLPLAFAIGTTIIALSVLSAARRGRREGTRRMAPFGWAVVAAAPLAAAGWAVGARYFYLPAVGICWAAAEAVAGIGAAAQITLATILILAGAAQAAQRRGDVLSYGRRIAATRRAVAAGLRAGHHVFHVDGGIKDIDLAVKEDPIVEAGQVLVLGDVPASFAIIPPQFAEAASILIAAPPLPPSGAYRFGDVQVVGLARRGDEPAFDEVLPRFPDLRFIRLRPLRGGLVIARDLTDEMKDRLDAVGSDGQD